MDLYVKNYRSGPIIGTKRCSVRFHPARWGFCIIGGREPVGLGLAEHWDRFFEITFLCWTFEITKESFLDEDGLVGNDRRVV